MNIKQEELGKILDLHKKYLNGEPDGQRAVLTRADLREADLRGADLRGAELRWAELRWADLRGAVLDFSCWPLWCGSRGVKIDHRLYTQLLAHLCAVDVNDEDCKAHQAASLELAKQSHIANDLGLGLESEKGNE